MHWSERQLQEVGASCSEGARTDGFCDSLQPASSSVSSRIFKLPYIIATSVHGASIRLTLLDTDTEITELADMFVWSLMALRLGRDLDAVIITELESGAAGWMPFNMVSPAGSNQQWLS